MKRIIIVLCVAAGLMAAACGRQGPSFRDADGNYDWEAVADGMSHSLIDRFWGANFEGYPQRYYFNYGSDLSDMTTVHYWPQAHGLNPVTMLYGGKWWEAPADGESVCLTAHLTGCMLIEAMCTLE